MVEAKEKCASMKFCTLLGKTAGETAAMLQTVHKDIAVSKVQVSGDSLALRMVTCHLKMNLVKEYHQPPKGMKTA